LTRSTPTFVSFSTFIPSQANDWILPLVLQISQ
jgi:hypothetical protein